MTTGDLTVLDPETIAGPQADRTVHGVVLAAGTSSRYGDKNKLLAEIDGKPLVRHATETLLDADLDGVTVVVGYEATRVKQVLEDLDVEFRVNDEFEAGQSSSLRAGVDAAREATADAVLFALGDMPSVDVNTVDALVDAYRRDAGTALAAGYAGRRGNPVLFDACHFVALAAVTGDTGGRSVLLSADRGAVVDLDDRGVLADVDRPDDVPE